MERKKVPLWAKILIGVVAGLAAIAIGIGIYANYLYGKMNIEKPEDVEIKQETFEVDENADDLEETKPEDVTWGDDESVKKSSQQVVNILFAGEEAMHSDPGRGRTDSIMIATLNTRDKALRLTSIMRDTYVQIPGHSDNKLNAAYGIGGMPLLSETIENNFNIKLDGYVLVGFDGFEQIIDYLGGIDITLSSVEANYLNTHDYIDDYRNKNLREGVNHMNGDQALGYARIRKVNNGNLAGDYGRTQRHRTILNAIFEKFKNQSLVEMTAMLPDLFSLVTTDLSRTQLLDYAAQLAGAGAAELETFRIPVDDAHRLTRINGMSVVLMTDIAGNNAALHDFIFGKIYIDKGQFDKNIMIK